MTKEFLAKLGITIDTAEVSDEEGQKLIEKKFSDINTEKTNNKNLVDKYASEIAGLKQERASHLTDEQKRQEEYDNLKQQVAESQKQLALRDKVADLVELGYDKETALKYATDELEGKPTIQYQKDFVAKKEAEVRAKVLQEQKPPVVNNDNNPPTKEEVIKGGYDAMLKLQKEKPETYKEYFGD